MLKLRDQAGRRVLVTVRNTRMGLVIDEAKYPGEWEGDPVSLASIEYMEHEYADKIATYYNDLVTSPYYYDEEALDELE